MKLINTTTFQLEDFISGNQPPYAILSHTWEKEEVSFQDFKDLDSCRHMAGFDKIQQTCQLARESDIGYAWLDTCCINKESSAELSEAINSMFRWYEGSVVCYVYLSDLNSNDDTVAGDHQTNTSPSRLGECRCFKRGWTLQELIAPKRVEFYDKHWSLYRGAGEALIWAETSRITTVDEGVLNGTISLHSIPVGHKISWAARRQTTRVEDMAYCLLGIFGVNMPMLYGEGEKAFIRLQEEISRGSTDMTLFCWRLAPSLSTLGQEHYESIFARSPADFIHANEVLSKFDHRLNAEYTLTNKGLRLRTIVHRDQDGKEVLPLNCIERLTGFRVGIYIKGYGPDMYARIHPGTLAVKWKAHAPDGERIVYLSTKSEQDLYSTPPPILFRYNFPVTDVVPIAPKVQWNFRAKAWMPQRTFAFTGLMKFSSKLFSDPVYVFLHRPEGRPRPSVLLANQFLLEKLGIGILASATEAPPMIKHHMLHDVVIFDGLQKERPVGLLSVSITLNSDHKTYIVDLVLDRSLAGSLPVRSVYASKVHMNAGYASEISIPTRQPGAITRKSAFPWVPDRKPALRWEVD